MESQVDGFEGLETNGGENKEVRVGNKRALKQGTSEIVLRLLALALTLSAAVILGVNKQTKVVSINIVDTLPPLRIPVSAKWHYLSAFMYFVVANAIASLYTALSFVVSLTNRGGGKSISGLTTAVLDVVMTALLFSANGAAAAIGMVGYKGNSHVQWKKVCNVFDRYCHQGATALVISVVGAVAFLLLVVLSLKRLHKN